jgi:excisionase family DNA binding protein
MTTLTPEDLATDLKLPGGVEAALRLLRSGEIPAYKIGRYWRVDSEELAEWKRLRAPRPSDPNRIAPRSARSEAAIGRKRRTA